MPIYPYKCFECGNEFEFTARISEIDDTKVNCTKCGSLLNSSHRKISSRQFFYGAKVEDAAFCNALGCVVKNNKHRQQIAKSRGMIEVGNEKPEVIHRHFEKEQAERDARRDAEMTHSIMSSMQ